MASHSRRWHGAPARRSRALLLAGPLAMAGVVAGAWGGSMLASHPTAAGAESAMAGRPRNGRVTVAVQLSALLQAQLGQQTISVSLPADADVGALLNRLSTDYPVLAAMGPSIMVAVSGNMAAPDTALGDGETVELMSPLAGG